MLDIEKLYDMSFNSSKQEMLNYLNECNCCLRHQNNKPYKCELVNEVKNNKKINKNKCECKCRHYARNICRNEELTFYLVDFI